MKRKKIKYGKYVPDENSLWKRIKNILRKFQKCNKIWLCHNKWLIFDEK